MSNFSFLKIYIKLYRKQHVSHFPCIMRESSFKIDRVIYDVENIARILDSCPCRERPPLPPELVHAHSPYL
jgi:hypothetical protein